MGRDHSTSERLIEPCVVSFFFARIWSSGVWLESGRKRTKSNEKNDEGQGAPRAEVRANDRAGGRYREASNSPLDSLRGGRAVAEASMLRRRGAEAADNPEESPFLPQMSSGSISCAMLMALHPAKSGPCEKKDNSWLAYLFWCFFSQWKERYLVLIGSYLYRFESELGETVKGCPIPIDSCFVNLLQDGFFEVVTLRKKYLVKVGSPGEAKDWVEALKDRKLQAIKENMGHAPLDPSIKRLNQQASVLFEKKLRKERWEAQDVSNPVLLSAM